MTLCALVIHITLCRDNVINYHVIVTYLEVKFKLFRARKCIWHPFECDIAREWMPYAYHHYPHKNNNTRFNDIPVVTLSQSIIATRCGCTVIYMYVN